MYKAQFFSDDYNDVIREAVAHHSFESTSTLIVNEVTVKGTKCKKRCFIGLNPERGTKAKRGKVVSKKKGVIVQKKSSAVNTHVSMLLKKLLDFEWDFI